MYCENIVIIIEWISDFIKSKRNFNGIWVNFSINIDLHKVINRNTYMWIVEYYKVWTQFIIIVGIFVALYFRTLSWKIVIRIGQQLNTYKYICYHLDKTIFVCLVVAKKNAFSYWNLQSKCIFAILESFVHFCTCYHNYECKNVKRHWFYIYKSFLSNKLYICWHKSNAEWSLEYENPQIKQCYTFWNALKSTKIHCHTLF